MGRKATKCTKKCSKHVFSLKPKHCCSHFSREVQASFCPPLLTQHPFYPIFNRDKKHYTSSFTLNHEQEKYQLNDSLYKAEHDRLCQQQIQGKEIIYQPKPRTKNSYCHVCKDYYEDYLKHILSSVHKNSIMKNQFSNHINNLIQEKFSAPSTEPRTTFEQITLEKEPSAATVINLNSSGGSEFSQEGKIQLSFKENDWKGVFELNLENDLFRIEQGEQKQKINDEKLISASILCDKKTYSIKTEQASLLNLT